MDFDHIMGDFHEQIPDPVLFDINLPSYDSYFWCRQIRKKSIIPVIIISAHIGYTDQVMASKNDGVDFITKPFHLWKEGGKKII